MGSRVEDLLSLARMLDEGKVSAEEYELVKAELLAAPAEEWLDGDSDAVLDAPAEPPTLSPSSPAAEPGVTGWGEQLRSIPAFLRWGVAGILVAILGIALFSAGDSPRVEAAEAPEAVTPAPEAAAGLGLRLQELEAAWNEAGVPPLIKGGFTLSPESGPLDSFLYRFDDAAILAGAYEPGEGSVYALMLRVGLQHPAIGDLNSHLCHLLHRFNQACLDSFAAAGGTSGASISAVQSDHDTSWIFETATWRLTIDGDVETVRVISAEQP